MLARQHPAQYAMGLDAQPTSTSRKRKAQSQENERLSKRLSLLNIGMDAAKRMRVGGGFNTCAERGGERLYVPVERPQAEHNVGATAWAGQQSQPQQTFQQPGQTFSSNQPPNRYVHPTPVAPPARQVAGDNMMLDDTKHKVYIYNLDDELSSESEDDSGRLVFLSDIDKHMKAQRVPAPLIPGPDGAHSGMEVVLYREPTSISVPEEQDGVRRAVAEARARLREQQRLRREGPVDPPTSRLLTWREPAEEYDPDAMDLS
jgi:hypothetical protein